VYTQKDQKKNGKRHRLAMAMENYR